MSENPDLRIGDAEREQALQALGEHLSAGRLTIDEYGERSAHVAAAKTRGQLTAVFVDLPEPHPKFTTTWATVAQPPARVPTSAVDRPPALRLMAAILPLLFVGAVLVGVTTGFWWLMALPFVTVAVGRLLWGHEWDRERQRHQEQQERRPYRGQQQRRRELRGRDWP